MAKKPTTKMKKKAVAAKGRPAKAPPRRAASKPRPAAPKPARKPAKKKAAPKKPAAVKSTRASAAGARPTAARPSARRAAPSRSAAGAKADREARRARIRRMQRFRQVLLNKYQDLVRAYNSAKGDTRRVTSDGTEDYIDYAVSSYDRDFSLSLSEMERTQIRMIEDALRRIDRGEYGDCQQCGEPIPEKRLEVEPWARHCVRCQALEEQGLLQARSYDSDYDDSEEGGDDYAEVEADEVEEEANEDDAGQEGEDDEFETSEAGDDAASDSAISDEDDDEDDERDA